MCRIGKLPIPVLDNANVAVDGQTVRVDGPKGKLEKTFDCSINIELADGEIRVTPANSSRHARAMFGTARSIINNMVIGVVEGFEKKLEIKGVGFRAVLEGDLLDLALGYSHPIKLKIPEGIKVKGDQNTKISVSGEFKYLGSEPSRLLPPKPITLFCRS